MFCTVVLALNFKSSFIDKYILYYFPTDIVPIQRFINSQQTILHFYQPQRNLYVLATNPLAPSNSLDLSNHWSAFFWICLLWTFHIYGTIYLMVFVASFFHIAYIFKLSDHYCTMCQHLVILNAARYPLVWTGHTIFMNSVVSRHFSCFHFFLVVVNNAAINICEQVFVWTHIFRFLFRYKIAVPCGQPMFNN